MDGGSHLHQEKGGSGLEQGEKSGSGGVMLHSAYVLKGRAHQASQRL